MCGEGCAIAHPSPHTGASAFVSNRGLIPLRYNALGFVMLASDAFTLTRPDGTILEQTGRYATGACLGDAALPASLVPGQSAEGFVYVEAPAGAAAVEWNPWGVPGSGWVWRFG